MLTAARRPFLAVVTMLAVLATTIVSSAVPASAAIVDAPRGGNPHFYWLPPVVPSMPQTAGTFDETVLRDLVIEVCELDAAGACVAGDPIEVMTSSSGWLLSRIHLVRRAELYSALWFTGRTQLDPATDYRVEVLLGDVRLGSVDVDVVRNVRELLRVNRSTHLGVLRGLPIPLTFRVEQPTAATSVRINEIESSGGTPGDWVELHNTSWRPINLAGYVIKDNDDTHAAILPADAVIAPGATYVVDESILGFGLGGADSVRFFAPDATTVIDSYSWTAHAVTTYGRCPDGSGAFQVNTVVTKGAPNDCSVVARINEIESSGGTPGDWVELYNAGPAPADFGGFVVKDNDDTHAYTIPAGTAVAPGGYAVLDEATLGFGLGGADSARLFRPDGSLADSYTWAEHTATTYGRCPNGIGELTTTSSATKGAANTCGAPLTSVKVNEVESSGGSPGDWIELHNAAATPVDVSGAIVRDNDDTHTATLPAGSVIGAGGFLIVEEALLGFGLGGEDSARLFAPDGTTLLDSYSWASHASTTYGRCPDGSGAFQTTTAITKGAANNCAAVVNINEVESSGGSPGDWIELYSPGAASADVSGWVVRDNDDTHTYTIPAGTTIAAGGYLVLEETTLGFGLGGADSARLFRPDASLADSYSWTEHAGTTYGRCPNGSGPFTTTAGSTKGAGNDCGAPASTVHVNEIESSGGSPGDWVELINTGSTPADVSGWVVRDNDDTHTGMIPAGSVIPAGGYLTVEESTLGFGLGVPDSVRLFDVSGTLVETYSWTAHAVTSYGRCPDGTGEFQTTTTVTKAAANDCSAAVKLNEVESSGGDPGDWIEVINSGTTAVDVSGWILRDNDDTHTYAIPAGTTIAPGAYHVVDEAALGFGLGAADSARLFDPAGALVDSSDWTAHAGTTYGRCPNGTGPFAATSASTKGLANICPGEPVFLLWPGSSTVQTVDALNGFGGNMSGLTYEGTGTATPGVLWAVRNGPGTMYRLVWNGTEWTADATNDWAAGKALHYADGTGNVDAEGVAFAGTGSAGGMYVASERDNNASSVSRNSILRYDGGAAGTSLLATHEWNITPDLPPVGSNTGLEAITWVPDSYLVGQNFLDEATGAPYNPATYANHGDGLFFVGVEFNGTIYAYALDHVTGGYTRVATIASGFPGVMALEFDRETSDLWALCDDGCQGRSSVLRIDTTTGKFAIAVQFEWPSGMPNLNNEGFAVAPLSECAGGNRPVFWADDSATGGHALRSGTLSCAPL